ncbi:MAG TPA: hypothetical protein DD640_00455, partial [Clostridiales bacterium]|nr:hypothetical protein [Clostridiales bacterium]
MKSNYAATTSELEQADLWLKENLLNPDKLPYSFLYGGRRIASRAAGWQFSSQTRQLDADRTEFTTILHDPATGLQVTGLAVQNHKYAALEWTLWFENTGEADSPVLSDIRAVDAEVLIPDPDLTKPRPNPRVILYHFKGDFCSPGSYEPLEHLFYEDVALTLHSEGGNPTNEAFPYYRIQGNKKSLIFVVSWQGQWETAFQPVSASNHYLDGLRVIAKQQDFHAKLLPGEKIRTPMIVLMPFDGTDPVRAQNLWRRWFIDFNMPRVNGELIKPFYANYSGRIFHEMEDATEENQKQYADFFFDNGIAFDYLWMDAGWYDLGDTHSWGTTGTWKPDLRRFPNGLRAISDYVHERGVKTMVWFEPERVEPDTELAKDHPEWLLQGKVLDLGNNEAREWITRRFNDLIKSEAIDLYRQDHNIRPLPYWQAGEAEDRRGIRENHHCTGYLKFWDDILAANPGIIIDSCASGGRRNDLETMRRALPLHKTDYSYANLTPKQGMHHTLFQWLPFFGSMNQPGDQKDITYHRSSLLLSYHGCENVFAPDFDFPKLAAWMQEWRETAHCQYGD